MIHHPLMVLINYCGWVKMKPLTCTHPLRQRIGIDEDADPTVAIGLGPISIIIVIDDMPVITVMVVPQTCPVRQVTEVDEVRNTEVEMTIGHLNIAHTPCKCAGVRVRGPYPLTPLHTMSGVMTATLMRTNTKQNFCVIIKALFMTE